MARVLGSVLFVIMAGVTSVALLTVIVFLLPGKTDGARRSMASAPGRTFVLGLVNFLFFGAIAALLSQGGDFLRLISFIIMLTLSGLGLIGLGGTLLLLRNRLYPTEVEGHSLPSKTIKTAILLVLALMTPFVGWFILAPILLLMGLGATIIALVRPSTTG